MKTLAYVSIGFAAIFAYFLLSEETPPVLIDSSESMELVKKIARNVLLNFSTKEEVAFETLWQDQTCVITFLRRFGWVFCRLGARELSDIKPVLDENNVRLIGVGLEELGVEEFIAGNYFEGDLFIDAKKKSFEDMGFKRFGILGAIPELVKRISREANARATAKNITGNLAGDGMQTGGTLVVKKGGEVLYMFKQTSFADHAPNEDILKALGIQPKPGENQEV